MSDELRWYLEPPESARPAVAPGASPPPYRGPGTKLDRLAVAAAVTGLLPPVAPAGILLGAIAAHRLRRLGGRSFRLAEIGLIGGIVWTVLLGAGGGYLLWHEHDLAAARDRSGAIVAAGRVSTADLRAGDCVTVPVVPAARWVEVVPCVEAHPGQVYDVRALAAGPYPGDEAVRTAVAAECAGAWSNAFPDDVRAAVSAAHGALTALAPTREGWSRGDTDFACIVTADALTGVIRPT